MARPALGVRVVRTGPLARPATEGLAGQRLLRQAEHLSRARSSTHKDERATPNERRPKCGKNIAVAC